MANYPTNRERTEDYLKNFDREKTLKHLVRETHPIIFDVGANNGITLDEFKSWWPTSEIHCFEPQQECWGSLEKRVSKHAAGEVTVNRCAAGRDSNDNATFFTHDITSGQSGFNKINLQSIDSIHLKKLLESDSYADALHEYELSLNHERSVKIIRLDDYLNASGIQCVNLLKIDTQGYEPEVLEGLGQRLSDVDVVITELMFYDFYEKSLSFSDIERYLLPAGFHIYDISYISKNPMNGRTDWVDVIYVNNRLRKDG